MKSRLNGWWRLWIVASALWCLTIAFTAAPSPSAFRSAHYELEHDNGNGKTIKFTVAFSRTLSEQEVRQQLDGDVGKELEKNLESDAGKLITWPYDNYIKEHAIPQLKTAVVVLFAPIIGVLLLGLSVAWVRKGFKVADT